MLPKEKVHKLREWMAERGIAACVVLSGDAHISEYEGEHWKKPPLDYRVHRFRRNGCDHASGCWLVDGWQVLHSGGAGAGRLGHPSVPHG
ncbi:hypothetical protein ACFTAO_37230 [Paenibacillus rhizoplanae]